MKTGSSIKSKILSTDSDSKIIFIRLITGLIFISEGLQKYLIVTAFGPLFFQEIGFSNPQFWVYFTGTFEILCGALILFGLFTRLASIPLLVIMIFAFLKTKLPLLATNGFWTFSHEYETEFALTILLVLLLIYGGGKWSVDSKILHSENS
jgi:putative oxidoreductase